MDYHNKMFRPLHTSKQGEIDTDTIFLYQQQGNILTCTYEGRHVQSGHLIGLVDQEGVIDMRYHQVHTNGALMTGICTSRPEFLPNGRIRLHESWHWTSGDCSAGHSILEELLPTP